MVERLPENPSVDWQAPPTNDVRVPLTARIAGVTVALVLAALALLWIGAFIAAGAIALVGVASIGRDGVWRSVGLASLIALGVYVTFLVAVTVGVFAFGWH